MIWLTQWLCPSRHCSIALLWDDRQDTRQDIERRGEDLYQKGVVTLWCGICGHVGLRIEHGPTRFSTLEEAEPHAKRLEAANALARLLIGGGAAPDRRQALTPKFIPTFGTLLILLVGCFAIGFLATDFLDSLLGEDHRMTWLQYLGSAIILGVTTLCIYYALRRRGIHH